MITREKKQAVIAELASDQKQTGTAEIQVGILTERIKEITEHLKLNKHDHMARRGLMQMVGRRKKLLKYLASKDGQAYLDLIKKLGIRK